MENISFEPLGNGIGVYVTDNCRFSTDTVLLADFSKPSSGKKCAELGTGCAAIPLIWCRENRNIQVDAVEIQPELCALAQKSVEANSLGDCVKIINSDLKSLRGVLPFGCYDLVACNPPYKISGGGIKSSDESKLIARHESECTLEDVCRAASGLLRFGGRLCICQRPERLADAFEAMRKFSIEPKKLRLVQQRPDKAPKLFLLEGRRGGKRGFLGVMPALLIEAPDGSFSAEMMRIYGSYKSGFQNRPAQKSKKEGQT